MNINHETIYRTNILSSLFKISCVVIAMKNLLKQVLENDDSIYIDSKSIRKRYQKKWTQS